MVAEQIKSRRNTGQATIEMAVALPLIIWLLYYTINAFYSVHTAHVAQKYAAMSLWQRVNNRSKYVMDDLANRLHNREFMAVQYTDEDGNVPRRKIVRGPVVILNTVGICREPGCAQ